MSKSLDVKASDEMWNGITAVWYIRYVNDNIFGPAGLWPRNLKSPPEAAKAYYYPSSGKGSRREDAVDQAGAGGWHLDVNELTRLMDHLRRRGTILPRSTCSHMLINHYGVDSEFGTRAGPVYHKNGRSMVKDNQCLDSLALFMPGNLSLALFVNSAPQGAPGMPAGADPPALSFTLVMLIVIASVEFGLF